MDLKWETSNALAENVSRTISHSFYELHYFGKVRRHFKGTSHTNKVFIDLKEVDVESLTISHCHWTLNTMAWF